MNKQRKLTTKDAGRRLDSLLTEITGKSRSFWQKQIKLRLVRINGQPAPASYKTQPGDRLDFDEPAEQATEALMTPDIPVLYQDKKVIVIDKPAGLLVHDITGRSQEPTVAAFAALLTTDDDPIRPGIVHRLDRDTSGVLIIARDLESKKLLQEQFKNHTAQKEYVLLVEGHLKQAEAVIDLPVGRKSDSARHVVSPGGKPAETLYKVVAEYPKHTLVSAFPKTGRTHQLRTHFSHLGHPVAGDKLYGAAGLGGLSRQFLHAHKLTIQLPGGKTQTFEAPLPADLQAILDEFNAQVY